MYKIDTHVHTGEVSPCGKIGACEMVRLYKDQGYSGVVITDHFFNGYFDSLGQCEWEDKIDKYLSGYRAAFIAGKEIGLNVMLGMEIRFTENPNDYLVYGINEDFLKENKYMYKLGLKEFSMLIENKDIFIYQAHPYRNGIIPADPVLIQGVEVYNGNLRHNSRNHLALEFASTNGLNKISGSDFHQLEDLARGGILISDNISSSEEFYNVLKEGRVEGLIES